MVDGPCVGCIDLGQGIAQRTSDGLKRINAALRPAGRGTRAINKRDSRLLRRYARTWR